MDSHSQASRARGFELLTRIGFAARGVLYLIIGYLAIEAGRTTGSSGALRMFDNGPAGRIALAVIALGLLAYGAWRLLNAAYDLEGAGSGAKGAATRAGHVLSGVVHIGLGLLAIGLLLGVTAGGSGGDGTVVGWVLGLPAGQLILRLVAAGIILGGLAQAWAAYRLDFLKQLDQEAARRSWVKWAGRLGYLARGLVFVLIGLLLWKAAGSASAQEAGGTGEALATLDGWQRTAVAAGLCLFGVFSIVQAVYRRITNPAFHNRPSSTAASARTR